MSEQVVKRKIRLLMIEDRITDAELVLHELRGTGFDPDWHRVETEAEYLAHLDPALDVILADYNLPGFDALTALRRLREHGLEIPFIIVSGTIGEEIAVEAMKQGAHDYVLKDRMARLGKAVAQVLEEKRLRDERKRAEEALKESEERYRLLVERTPDAILVHDEGKIEFVNPAASRLLGAESSQELLGKQLMEIVPPEYRAAFQERIRQTAIQGQVPLMEQKIVRLDGTVIEVEAIGIPFTHAGKPAVQTILRDITERKRAQQALAASEAELRALFAAMTDIVLVLDRQGRYLQIAPTNPALLYKPPAQLLGRTIHEVLPAADADNILEHIRLALEQQHPIHVEYSLPIRGVQVWFDGTVSPMGPDKVFWISRDITERKRAEQRLTTQHAITQALAVSTKLAEAGKKILQLVCQNFQWNIGELWTMDPATGHLRCTEVWHPASSAFREFATISKQIMFAKDEGLPGRVCATGQALWVEDIEAANLPWKNLTFQAGLRSAIAFPIKVREQTLGVIDFFSQQIREPDNELLTMFASVGSQLGQFIERQQIEQQFHHSQKMEAIGTLAGGIAHDFNNILTAIIGFGQVLRSEIQPDHAWHEPIKEILKAADRAKDLVRRILTFSRKQDQQRVITTLQPIVSEVVSLLRASLPATIEICAKIDSDCPTVLADPTQVHQVLMNLATNAAYAMRDNGGRLVIALNRVEVGRDLAHRQPSLRVASYVRLTVTDTGCGMDDMIRARIFDPFFTTKPPGEGTGLGLSVVHGIMENHDGAITVNSELGKGTTFQLYFPAVATGAERAIETPAGLPKGHGQRILFVDDELVICELAERMLQLIGYAPAVFRNAEDALAAFRAAPGQFDAVVSDLTMPRMTGFSLAAELQRLRPNVPIVLMTGYAGALDGKQARKFGIGYVLAKPFSLQGLSEILQEALSRSR